MVAGMTDMECMYHRFSRKNLKKSTGTIAQVLGVSRREYEAAVKRGMEREARMLRFHKLCEEKGGENNDASGEND